MVPERVADNVYIFTSSEYAKVNAGAIVGPKWAIVIDTLAFPHESIAIRDFLKEQLQIPARYLINTHFHSDHTLGTCWFEDAIVISSEKCARLLMTRGKDALAAAKTHNKQLEQVEIVEPQITFSQQENISIRSGKRTLTLMSMPGHSPDGIGVLLEEDRVLFSGDAIMSVPTVFDGEIDVLRETLRKIPEMKLENIVPGHGDVILRGEVTSIMDNYRAYLDKIEKHARKALRRRDPEGFIKSLDIEDCGIDRIVLNGVATLLHHRNMFDLYHKMRAAKEAQAETG